MTVNLGMRTMILEFNNKNKDTLLSYLNSLFDEDFNGINGSEYYYIDPDKKVCDLEYLYNGYIYIYNFVDKGICITDEYLRNNGLDNFIEKAIYSNYCNNGYYNDYEYNITKLKNEAGIPTWVVTVAFSYNY